MRHWFPLSVFVVVASCQNQACPSMPGGPCDPRNANCPGAYTCAVAEICTHACEQTSDCWVKVDDGCRYTDLPGQRGPDGGIFMEVSEDGFCPESKLMACLDGYCQRFECADSSLPKPFGFTFAADGGCDYDLYGPSPVKGNRDQGPEQ